MCSRRDRLTEYLDAPQNLIDLEKGPLREFVHLPRRSVLSIDTHTNSGRGSGGARRGVGHREGIVEQLFPLNIH
jgi:hypothetical protein